MAEPLIFVNTYAVKPGQRDAVEASFSEVAELVEGKEPRMLYLGFSIDPDGAEATTVQVHADADNMRFHMELIADHLAAARDQLDFSTMRIQLFGSPPEDLVEQMRAVAGAAVTVHPRTAGFDRFGD